MHQRSCTTSLKNHWSSQWGNKHPSHPLKGGRSPRVYTAGHHDLNRPILREFSVLLGRVVKVKGAVDFVWEDPSLHFILPWIQELCDPAQVTPPFWVSIPLPIKHSKNNDCPAYFAGLPIISEWACDLTLSSSWFLKLHSIPWCLELPCGREVVSRHAYKPRSSWPSGCMDPPHVSSACPVSVVCPNSSPPRV